MAKYIESIQTNVVSLQIYECDCGFHIDIDATYLDQVADVKIECPSCGELVDTEELDK